MNLYEINAQILDCIDQETGEVMDIDRLEELNMEKAEKVDTVASAPDIFTLWMPMPKLPEEKRS